MEKQKGTTKLDAKEDNIKKELTKELPIIHQDSCNFQGYDIDDLMKETSHLRKMITKRGTLEILIPLCCNTTPVRYQAFRKSMKGFSSKTLSIRLKELEKGGILSRRSYNEIPPRVEYTLTDKGQELTESMISLLQWMKRWSST